MHEILFYTIIGIGIGILIGMFIGWVLCAMNDREIVTRHLGEDGYKKLMDAEWEWMREHRRRR